MFKRILKYQSNKKEKSDIFPVGRIPKLEIEYTLNHSHFIRLQMVSMTDSANFQVYFLQSSISGFVSIFK